VSLSFCRPNEAQNFKQSPKPPKPHLLDRGHDLAVLQLQLRKLGRVRQEGRDLAQVRHRAADAPLEAERPHGRARVSRQGFVDRGFAAQLVELLLDEGQLGQEGGVDLGRGVGKNGIKGIREEIDETEGRRGAATWQLQTLVCLKHVETQTIYLGSLRHIEGSEQRGRPSSWSGKSVDSRTERNTGSGFNRCSPSSSDVNNYASKSQPQGPT
jgi:hypothetical protein